MKIRNGVPFANSVSLCPGWVTHLCVSVVTSNYVRVVTSGYVRCGIMLGNTSVYVRCPTWLCLCCPIHDMVCTCLLLMWCLFGMMFCLLGVFILTGITSSTAITDWLEGSYRCVGFYHTVLGGFLVAISYQNTCPVF